MGVGTRSLRELTVCGGVRNIFMVVVEMRGGDIRSLDRALPKRGRDGDDIIMSESSLRPGEGCTVIDEVVLLEPLLRIEELR